MFRWRNRTDNSSDLLHVSLYFPHLCQYAPNHFQWWDKRNLKGSMSKPFKNFFYQPWKGPVLHRLVSFLGPEHRACFLDGAGLVQVRLRSSSPSLQTALQSPQSLQFLHLAQTTISERDKMCFKKYSVGTSCFSINWTRALMLSFFILQLLYFSTQQSWSQPLLKKPGM